LGKYAIKQHLEKGTFKKKRILELGAGTGLLATMLASLGIFIKQQYLIE
jgi:2-polyprenyl-3-methyl-5-hydroxy-6-metoxy-1,4-benzoquinol methylase